MSPEYPNCLNSMLFSMPSSHPKDVPASSQHSLENYRGKNFAFLLVAIAAPAACLYLRLVLGYVATESRVSRSQLNGLAWWSNVALALFFITQLISAGYMQRLLKPRTALPAIALQYVAVLLLGIMLSVTGAVLLEGFGYTFFLHARNARIAR